MAAWLPGPVGADFRLPTPGEKPERNRKKKTEEPSVSTGVANAPPLAASTTAAVARGESVEIPLKIHGLPRPGLQFRIKTEPAHGSLSPVRMKDGATGVVTYTHSGAIGTGSDRFTFAAATSRGVSVPAEVVIQVREQAPQLIAPTSIDFGSVPYGHASAEIVMIRNAGGGVITGALAADEPWQIQGDSTYSIGPGGEQAFEVIFQPQEHRHYQGAVRFADASGRIIQVSGKGVPPISVDPETLVLQQRAGAGNAKGRSASVTITNHTAEPQEVAFTSRNLPGLSAPPPLQLDPGASETITLIMDDEHPSAAYGSVTVQGAENQIEIPVQASALPARILYPSDGISLGTVVKGTPAAGTVPVENAGGSTAAIRAEAGAPFRIHPDDRRFDLPPGATREVRVEHDGVEPGRHRAMLRLTGGYVEAEIPLRLNITADVAPVVDRSQARRPAASGRPRPAPKRTPARPQKTPAATTTPSAAVFQEPRDADVPVVQDLRLEEAGKTRATVVSTNPGDDQLDFRIEERRLRLLSSEALNVRWTPEEAVIERDGKLRRVTFEDLLPGQRYIIRLTTISPDGRLSYPSRPLSFATVYQTNNRGWLMIALVILLAIAAYLWRRRKIAESG